MLVPAAMQTLQSIVKFPPLTSPSVLRSWAIFCGVDGRTTEKKGARPEGLAPFLCLSFLPTVASTGWGTPPALPRKGRAQTMPSTMAVTKQNDMIAASTFIRILRSIVYSFGRRGCPAWSLRWFNSSFAGAP